MFTIGRWLKYETDLYMCVMGTDPLTKLGNFLSSAFFWWGSQMGMLICK